MCVTKLHEESFVCDAGDAAEEEAAGETQAGAHNRKTRTLNNDMGKN